MSSNSKNNAIIDSNNLLIKKRDDADMKLLERMIGKRVAIINHIDDQIRQVKKNGNTANATNIEDAWNIAVMKAGDVLNEKRRWGTFSKKVKGEETRTTHPMYVLAKKLQQECREKEAEFRLNNPILLELEAQRKKVSGVITSYKLKIKSLEPVSAELPTKKEDSSEDDDNDLSAIIKRLVSETTPQKISTETNTPPPLSKKRPRVEGGAKKSSRRIHLSDEEDEPKKEESEDELDEDAPLVPLSSKAPNDKASGDEEEEKSASGDEEEEKSASGDEEGEKSDELFRDEEFMDALGRSGRI